MASDISFARNYDRLYAHKDYAGEAATVLGIYDRYCGGWPRAVLDVGCGTGNHALEFARRGCYVVGVDTDPAMIEVAQGKTALADRAPDFYAGPLSRIDGRGFDLAVALFNVVNYVLYLPDLLAFFRDVAKRVRPGGLFVVDAWNGVAATISPPGAQHGKGGAVQTDLMLGIIDVWAAPFTEEGIVPYHYTHRLWPPWLLSEAARMARLETQVVTQQMQPDNEADAYTWKITLVMRRTR